MWVCVDMDRKCVDRLEAENAALKARNKELLGGTHDSISDKNKKRLFKGTALDYVRHRALKFERVYGDKKQATWLRKLATDVDVEIDGLKAQVLALKAEIEDGYYILVKTVLYKILNDGRPDSPVVPHPLETGPGKNNLVTIVTPCNWP